MRVSDYVVEFLVERGILDVFLVSGGGIMYLTDAVGLNEELFRDELRCAVQVNRIYCFICAQRQNAVHHVVQRCLDDVLATVDVGLNRLNRIVFARWHLFKGGCMNDPVSYTHLDVYKRQIQYLNYRVKPDWMVIDNYSIGLDWERQVRPHVKRIMRCV